MIVSGSCVCFLLKQVPGLSHANAIRMGAWRGCILKSDRCSCVCAAADVTVECKGLRSKRYISDGYCTSLRPVDDFVCTGHCLPIGQLPWYAEFIKIWSRQKTLQYQCVDDLVRHRKVTFVCENGETRTYDIKVVRSCKCKRTVHSHNQSSPADKPEDEARGGEGEMSLVQSNSTNVADNIPNSASDTHKNGKTSKGKKKKGRRRKPLQEDEVADPGTAN